MAGLAPARAPTDVGESPLRMRDARLRLNDFYEVYEQPQPSEVQREAARCMSCGAAFCTPEGGYQANDGSAAGCPISNRIPEWNELAERGRWREAYDRLALTNNFPEFTSRVCPAPCQEACIVGIHDRPVAIKGVERAIIDRAFAEGWVVPRTPESRNGRKVAVIGSGPAGLTAADELNARGYSVSVYERTDEPGGLLMYGIPNMKLDKDVLRRRIDLMRRAGVRFVTGVEVGVDIDPVKLRGEADALILAVGAQQPRDLPVEGRGLHGVVQAMPYLEAATRHMRHRNPIPEAMDAAGKHVVVIGGGDTGADCIATALRQGADSLVNITRRSIPPDHRDGGHLWPGPTGAYVLDYAHAEGVAAMGEPPRAFGLRPLEFVAAHGGGAVGSVLIEQISDQTGTARVERLPANLVILAIGFTGSDQAGWLAELGWGDEAKKMPLPSLCTNVYVAGDMRHGPSLVVHAIADGRAVALRVHHELSAHLVP